MIKPYTEQILRDVRIMSREPGPYDPCLCGRGDQAKFCCKPGKWWVTPATSIASSSPPTGNALSRCYARSLNDCGNRLSSEHGISEAVLRQLNEYVLVVSPTKALKTKDPIPVENLGSKVLCDRHNSALSPLDTTAARLFALLQKFSQTPGTEWHAPQDEFALVNGHDVERWLLKAACSYIASGQAADPAGQALPDREVDPSNIATLFDKAPWPESWSLCFASAPGNFRLERKVGETLIFEKGTNGICGYVVDAAGYELTLAFGQPGNDLISRPGRFVIESGASKKHLIFGWNDGRRHRTCDFEHRGNARQ